MASSDSDDPPPLVDSSDGEQRPLPLPFRSLSPTPSEDPDDVDDGIYTALTASLHRMIIRGQAKKKLTKMGYGNHGGASRSSPICPIDVMISLVKHQGVSSLKREVIMFVWQVAGVLRGRWHDEGRGVQGVKE